MRRNRLGQFVWSARSVGRFPFLNRVESYLHDARRPTELTYRERARKLKMLARVYADLRQADPTLHPDPKRFGEREVCVLLSWMQDRRLGTGYR